MESGKKRTHFTVNTAARRRWVKGWVIADITGWQKHQMYRARQEGVITWRYENGHFEYDLLSIPQQLIKNPESIPSNKKALVAPTTNA